jgi:prepilin-type N-terminal cleavage/methylation domain-containing protein
MGKRGFTLIELLAVIAIIAVLMAVMPFSGAVAARSQPVAELKVHLAQANHRAAYAFVRARFEPGELSDPWAVRFLDPKGSEIPYFVWDCADWRTAQEGRREWGGQYPLLQHHPGNDPKVVTARQEKIAWAEEHWPDIGHKLQEQQAKAQQLPQSVCCVLYLLRYTTEPYAKERLTLQIYATRQREVQRQDFTDRVQDVEAGDLAMKGFPLNPIVTWKGKELFRYAGFQAAGVESGRAHVDPARGYQWTLERGIVTKVCVRGKTEGRLDGETNWECTYWLFPEGACVGLEGFSLSKPDRYSGGEQEMSLWETAGKIEEVSGPKWETPWYVHKLGDGAVLATHLYRNAPLSVGYDNNPFITGEADKQAIRTEGSRLGLGWTYEMLSYPSLRMFLPDIRYCAVRPDGKQLAAIGAWMREHPEEVRKGELPPMPQGVNAQDLARILPALPTLQWKPRVDWLYRQYAVGVGGTAQEADRAIRHPLGAAGGWIDRPWQEKELAEMVIRCVRYLDQVQPVDSQTARRSLSQVDLDWYLFSDFTTQKQDELRLLAARAALTQQVDRQMRELRQLAAAGKDPVNTAGKEDGSASPADLQKDRQAAWMANPAYTARALGDQLRILEWLGLPYPRQEYERAVRQFAEFTLKLFGGDPVDMNRYRQRYRQEWPSRVTMLIPLMLEAHRLTGEDRYAQAARMVFDDVFAEIERNPLGYWETWSFDPQGDRPFDTTYNTAGFWRGLGAFWQDRQLKLIGDKAAKLVAAEARWMVVGRLYSDSFETESTTYYASGHGGHPSTRAGIFEFLHDDFDFYRGLVGELLRWQLLAPERYDANAYRLPCQGDPRKKDSVWLEWALGVYGGQHWDGQSLFRCQ